MNERTQILIKLITSHIILIIGLIFISVYATKATFLFLSITQTVLCILYFAGYWEFFGQRFRKFFSASIEFLILLAFAWKIYLGINNDANAFLLLILSLIQAYLLFELIKIIIVILKKDSNAPDIEFPFKQGHYLITDGGDSRISRLMNYHYYSPTHRKNKTNNSMLYATDIVKFTNDESVFLPEQNEAYPVFNEKIYCPMGGIVVKVENNIPDNKPFAGNYTYNTGNTVIIKNDNLYLLLGHLKKGSIIVKEGDKIQTNDLIGAAGNSGWTERPHLHMQLIKSDTNNYWFGKGVCIRYKNKNLYKNRLINM